jgi:uncharacterized phage protein gp47/JayE
MLLQQAVRSYYVATAEGFDLVQRAADFGIAPKPGTPSRGYMLVSSAQNLMTLQVNTVFLDPATGLEFLLDTTDDVTLSFLVETKLPIICSSIGERGNLNAGTTLITPLSSNVQAVVGTHRTSTGEVCGGLAGGSDPERDIQLRLRLIDHILNRRGTTLGAVRAALEADSTADWVYIDEPVPGVLQVWIDYPTPLTSGDFERLRLILESVRPAGTYPTLQQVVRQFFTVKIKVSMVADQDMDDLTANILTVLRDYVLRLPRAGRFSTSDVTNLLQVLPGVRQLILETPTSDVLAAENSVLRLENVVVSYDL